jgi:putative tryptophan/tyrosine transport system substrate-binding protein
MRAALLLAAAVVSASIGCGGPWARDATGSGSSVARIGYLASRNSLPSSRQSFLDGLAELGYVQGRTAAVDFWIEGDDNRSAQAAAAGMVASGAQAIVAEEAAMLRAAMAATETVPIVMVGMWDAAEAGVIQSKARPGGNVTGLSGATSRLAAKQLELLKEAVPQVTRVAALVQRPDASDWPALVDAAAQLNVDLVRLEAPQFEGAGVDAALDRALAQGANGLLALGAGSSDPENRYVAQVAVQYGLPSIAARTGFVEGGGLLAFAPSASEEVRRAAVFVDKLLRGVKPAETPVEEPTSFFLAVNLNTANQLRIPIAPSIVARATRLISSPAARTGPFVPERAPGLSGPRPPLGPQDGGQAARGWSEPDAFGYRYIDSRGPGGPEPIWYEGVSTGIAINSREPGYRLGVPIGFDFPFYGYLYSRLAIHTDGVVAFRRTDAFLGENQRLPGSAAINIAAFWDDLPVAAQGRMSYRLYGRVPDRAFVIQWSGGRYRDSRGEDSPAVQLALHEDGRIVMAYALPVAAADRGSATIGIQNETRSVGLTYAHNQALIRDGLTILFARPANATALPYAPSDSPGVTLTGCQHEGTGAGFRLVLESEVSVRSQIGCPLGGERSLVSTEQFFDGGHMVLRPDTRQITVTFEDNRRWASFPDTYAGGPEPPLDVRPPVDRDPPEGAFRKLWQENPGLRQRLGWPVGRPRAFTGTRQEFQRGWMLFTGEGQWLRAYLEDGTTVQG